MAKKLTFEFVKNYIEKENYTLLSTEYKNTRSKLKLKCTENHIFEMRFNNFKNGQRCPICKDTTFSYSHIKESIEKNNKYILISTNYTNCNNKLSILCKKCNKIWKVTFGNFKYNHSRCPECRKLVISKKLTKSFEYIKHEIEKNGEYLLISTKYNGSKEKIEIKCLKCNNIWKIYYTNWLGGKRCPQCAKQLTTSKGEKEVLNHIQSKYSGKIIENDRNTILNPLTNHYLEIDIYLPELKKAIEYNGNYWHSKKYQIKKDEIKVNQCEKLNIDLLIIKESEWLNNKDKCIDEIFSFIN